MNLQANLDIASVVWVVDGLLGAVALLGGFIIRREISRNDDQDERLRKVEQSCVQIETIKEDVKEVKRDVKTLLMRRQ